jgi:asparagine synthetase B (glutamine-hydrolysing)
MPLYFASRGIGQLYPLPNETLNTLDDSPTATPYTCTARVLLSGLGSDELLGGYSRHRAAYRNNGWVGLIEEVSFTHVYSCQAPSSNSHTLFTRYRLISFNWTSTAFRPAISVETTG